MLVPGNHDVDVIGVDHAQPDRRRTDLRLAEHHVIEQIGEGQPVEAG